MPRTSILRILAGDSAPRGSVVFLRRTVRTIATVAHNVEEFVRINVGRLQTVLVKASTITSKARDVTQQVATVIESADEFVSALQPVIADITTVKDAVNEVLDLTNLVDEVMAFLAPVINAVDNFVQANIVKHIDTAIQYIASINGYVNRFNKITDIVDNAHDFLVSWLEKLLEYVGGGREVVTLADASTLAHCSSELCIRDERRSGFVYRNVIFPARFLQFFFEKTGRVVLPGLFEGWVPRGIAAMDADTTLVTLVGVGANEGAPPIMAVMTPFTGGVRRLLQLYMSDGTTPYVGCMAPV